MANSKTGIATTQTVALGSGGSREVSTLTLRGKDAGSWNGSVQLVGGAAGGSLTKKEIPYRVKSLAAGAQDDSTVATAAITDTDFLIIADVSGMDVDAVVTRSAGSIDLEWSIASG